MPSNEDTHEVRHARDSEGNVPEQGVVTELSELARELQAEPDMATLLNHIVAATVAEIDGAAHGGISLMTNKSVQAVAATNDIVRHLDERQNEVDEGPCLTSLREHVTVRSDDLRHETRWPKFAASAVEDGVRSMLSVQLFVEGDNFGALNLYGAEPNGFSTADEYTAMAFASHAAVAMKGSRVESNLKEALASRDTIGQAKGILMERYKIGPEEAFNLLVVSSQRVHAKLRDIADHLNVTGELRVD